MGEAAGILSISKAKRYLELETNGTKFLAMFVSQIARNFRGSNSINAMSIDYKLPSIALVTTVVQSQLRCDLQVPSKVVHNAF